MATKKALTKTEKKILVTGGTGFLGAEIVRKMLAAGEKNIRVMASRVPDWMRDSGVEAVEGSVANREDVAAAVRNVSVILHLAGKVSRTNEDAAIMNKIHVEGTRILCEAAGDAGVSTIILASSSGTIAVSEEPDIIDETYPPPLGIISRWAYYSSKYYQEKTALENFGGEGCRLVIMNPTLLFGPGDERLSSTKIVLDFMGRKIPYCPGGGLSFVDVRDAAEAFISAIDRGRHGEKYLLGAVNMKFDEFFSRLERLSGTSAPSMKIPKTIAVAGAGVIDSLFRNWQKVSPIETGEVQQAEHFWYLDSSKAAEQLDFSQRDPQETLYETIRFIRDNFLGEGIFS